MKRLLILFTVLLSGCAMSDPVSDSWQRGNDAYMAGDYTGAIEAYMSIVDEGLESHKLYYNLGNAYFKDGQLGCAILFYNRALALRPGDRDTRYNLEIAQNRVRVRIEPVPRFFFALWVDSLRATTNSNGWAAISLLALAITLVAAILYLLAERLVVRKTGFYVALAGIIAFVGALTFSIAGRRDMVHSPEAIVLSNSVTVKTSPDSAAHDAFVLFEGTKVYIMSSLDTWSEVEIADGNTGWIPSSAIERVR